MGDSIKTSRRGASTSPKGAPVDAMETAKPASSSRPALIVGASRGLGLALAQQYLRRGWAWSTRCATGPFFETSRTSRNPRRRQTLTHRRRPAGLLVKFARRLRLRQNHRLEIGRQHDFQQFTIVGIAEHGVLDARGWTQQLPASKV